MGTLIATGFMRGGKAVTGSGELNTGAMAAFFEAFAAGIMERGGAKPGEKTILDTLVPAAEALKRAAENGTSHGEALQSALDAAENGAESAKAMRAVHGRPSYYGDKSVGREDPGACVGVLIVGAFAAQAAGA
jgi:dihydroxyacetone kinase-like protein